MFDHRLARVMHQDKVNSAEFKRREKASTSDRPEGIDWKRAKIITIIARVFSAKAVTETNRNPSTPRYSFGEKAGSR